MILDIMITNKISIIPTIDYGKIITNKKKIYYTTIKWLMFDIIFKFNKKN